MSLNFTMSDLEYFTPDEWFTYGKNINSYTDLGLVVGKIQKPLMPQVQEGVQDIPGMYGDVFTGNDYGELTFTIPVTIMAFNHTSYNLIIENIRTMLTMDSDTPGEEYPIVFGDNPNVKYYGHWGQIADPTFLTSGDWQAQTQLTFICSQPYGYLDQETVQIKNEDQPIIPDGNAKTYPIYKAFLHTNIYGIGFSNKDGYVATGYQDINGTEQSVDFDDTDDQGNRINDTEPAQPELPTQMSDWDTDPNSYKQYLGFKPDGDIDGAIGPNNNGEGLTLASTTRVDKNRTRSPQKQQCLNYGNPQKHKTWYGPLAIHHQFNNPTHSWKLMVQLFNIKNTSDGAGSIDIHGERAMGHCEVYLLDELGRKRGEIYIHDWQKGMVPRVGFTLYNIDGTHPEQLINDNDSGNYGNNYNNGNSAIGPAEIGGVNIATNNGTPKQGYPMWSLEAYKKMVKIAKKTKKRAVSKKLRKNSKRSAKRTYRKSRRQARTTARSNSTSHKKALAQSKKKYGNGRHVPHHYNDANRRKNHLS